MVGVKDFINIYPKNWNIIMRERLDASFDKFETSYSKLFQNVT